MKIKNIVAMFAMAVVPCFVWGKSVSLDLREPVQTGPVKLRAITSHTTGGELRSVNLDAGAADVDSLAIGDELVLTLFDDVALTLTLTDRMPNPLGGDAFLAEVSGYEGVRNAVVLCTPDGLTIDIHDYDNKRVYKVISTATGVSVREIKPSEGKKCGHDVLKAPSMTIADDIDTASPVKAKSIVSQTGQMNVDILVAYDTTAAEWANANCGGVRQFAEVSVQKMNAALRNTMGDSFDSYFRFRLVGVYEIGGPGVSGTNNDDACEKALDAAVDGTMLNGVSWAGIAKKRNEVGADIVVTLIDTNTDYGTVGIGYSFEPSISGFSESAYNCCAIRSVYDSHTMTHEVGHNMGAGHATAVNPKEIDPGPQYYDYSAGHHFTADGVAYHTIMAYDSDGFGNTYSEVPYFSSPALYYKGVALGDAKHDNRLTLIKNYAKVAAFRATKVAESEDDPEPEPTLSGANDMFADAFVIDGAFGSVLSDNINATAEEGEPLSGYGTKEMKTVWWKWTAPISGAMKFSTVGSNYDTVMGVYTGTSLAELVTIGENDDEEDSVTSAVTFAAEAGNVYYIAVAGSNDECGSIQLNWAAGDAMLTVMFNAGKGIVSPEATTLTSGSSIGTLPTPTRKGYMFDGWWTAENGGTQITETTAVVANMICYAHWIRILTPCVETLSASDITAAYVAPKAVTLKGAVYDGCDVVGVVELKLGKVNARRKTSRISASVTGIDGKKKTARAVTVSDIEGVAPVTVELAVKGWDTMTVAIGGDQFAGEMGKYHVQSAEVGGVWTKTDASVFVAADDVSMFSGEVIEDLLPDGERVLSKNGKWAFAKATGVKYVKPRGGTEKEIQIDANNGKTNLSGIKLTYTPRTGVFKGSFKVYALEGEGARARLKKYTVKVTGLVVNGIGTGEATLKKPAVSWPVRVE